MFGGFNEVAAHRRLHMTSLKNTELKYVEAREKKMYRSTSQQQSN